MSGLKRVVAHWTVGKYNANSIDRKHYHFIVEGDGKVVSGNHAPEANIRPRKGKYAAHVLRLNTGSIGISMASMLGAQSTKQLGAYPFTEVQFNAMCRKIAELCQQYDIAVTPQTVLSHAEVQPTLGVKQRGKWDFTVVPFMPEKIGARACGDEMRKRVTSYMQGVEPTDSIVLKPGARGKYVKDLQEQLNALHFDLDVDGHYGPKTEAAVRLFQDAHGLKVDGYAGNRTMAAIGKTIKAVEASDPVSSHSNTMQGLTGGVTAAGVAGGALAGIDWQTLAVIGGYAALIIIMLFVFKDRAISTIKDVRKAVSS